jgi:general secretion pathway protein I
MSDRIAGGFTLLEVVIALAIASLALVALFRAGGDGLVAVSTASRAEEAVQRAQSHLAALGRDEPLPEGQTEGDDGGGYRWHLRVAPMARWQRPGSVGAPAGETILYDVEVSVSWRGNGHDHAIMLSTERIASTAPRK